MEWNVRLESLYCVWCDVLYSDVGIVEYNELNYCKSIIFILLTIIPLIRHHHLIIIFIFIIIISLSSSWIMIMFLIHFPIYILPFNGSSFRHRQTHSHRAYNREYLEHCPFFNAEWMSLAGWIEWVVLGWVGVCVYVMARNWIELKETELPEKRNRKNLIIHKNRGLCHEKRIMSSF